MPLVRCDSLSLSYEGKTVLSDVSFSLERGQSLCVLGENGCGKSTLLSALAGLKKPEGGTLTFGEGVRASTGFLPQTPPQTGVFPATVRQVVSQGVRRKGPFFSAAERARIEEALKTLSLTEVAERGVHLLSGGMRQRVLIARALCAARELLLLDEPVSGLDPKMTHELYHLIRSLTRSGLSIVLVSHDVLGAVDFCTHVLHLKEDGHFFGTSEAYKKSPLYQKEVRRA